MEASSSELSVNEISKVIKILGVNFTFSHSLFYKLNFESIVKSLRGLLKGWSWRGLTLLGKISCHTEDLIQDYSHLKQKGVHQENKYFIIFFCLEGKR